MAKTMKANKLYVTILILAQGFSYNSFSNDDAIQRMQGQNNEAQQGTESNEQKETFTVRTLNLQNDESSYNRKKIINPVAYNTVDVNSSDVVYVRYKDMIQTRLVIDNRQQDLYAQPKNTSRYRANSYRRTHILRTWKDHNKFVAETLKNLRAQYRDLLETDTEIKDLLAGKISPADVSKENLSLKLKIKSEFDRRKRIGEDTSNTYLIEQFSNEALKNIMKVNGIQSLRYHEVQVAVPNATYDSVYNIAELGLTDNKDIRSGFFDIGESVMFPTKASAGIAYLEGRVVAILGDGDVLVERGLDTARVVVEDVFSLSRDYALTPAGVNGDVLYRHQTKSFSANLPKNSDGSFISVGGRGSQKVNVSIFPRAMKTALPVSSITEIQAKVIAASPSGDVLIHVPKIGQKIRIAWKDMTHDQQNATKNLIRRMPVQLCGSLFL